MAFPYPQVVLLGDSLIQHSAETLDGFSLQSALQTRCLRRFDVINRGFSGWNTANAMKFIDQIFPKPSEASPRIKFLVVLLGANDAVIPLPTTTQHVPLDQYKKNLTTIVNHPHILAHEPKILLVTPPPVDEIRLKELNMAEGHPCAVRTSAISSSYSETARQVARENAHVVSIDLWKGIMDKAIAMTPDDYKEGGPLLGTPDNGNRGGLASLLPDGLHMSGDAYRVFYGLLKPHIGEEWVNLPVEDRTGYLFPDWRELAGQAA
ncbi:GDSL Lipase/Acylhydrolase family protein [Purpureocillium lilacinum]|uniref:GDSL Lipase/Acylhydrolase family protein n=2 Tax=Purpureocillium lilacinum TaxID=33203 RepID=A0A179HHZ2_PURLI|nr:GDSL Lipase/Acylhydrolase family protein [Purpureocillium lilacinum]OAQ84705.1 GDSL Lipase/Acylhydrolase family protein [Purpureocillium lilacinum]OAQ89248.1 GDSL Lipase/Acylhydrolase family protein [Purpureocillium lilacinum]GJN77350.1 hypothetical protein PLIIFM63780_000840 [Purpureocillium lilacinum]